MYLTHSPAQKPPALYCGVVTNAETPTANTTVPNTSCNTVKTKKGRRGRRS